MAAIDLEERIRIASSLGESHFREYKSAIERGGDVFKPRNRKSIAVDIGRTLVAFANADGGELLVGVEDNGQVTGLLNTDEATVSYLLGAVRTAIHPDTPLRGCVAVDVKVGEHTVLYFSTRKSTEYIHLTSDGRCLQRRDLESCPISSEAISWGRQEQQSREYDRAFVDGAGVDCLDLELVSAVAESISSGMSPEKCLQYLGLAEFSQTGLCLRRAALLLFADEPAKWHPRLQLRIIKVKGTDLGSGENYNVASDSPVAGNILQLAEHGWEALRPHLTETRFTGEAKFRPLYMYPEFACREALINAIAHRDYSQEGREIEIFIFDDRMEVKSPGSLLSTLTIEDLLKLEGAHQSRNSLVSRVLREAGYMRELGEGMRRIFELMKSNELAPPEIDSTADSFRVVLHHRPMYRPEHLLWLDEFSSFDLGAEEKAIVILGYGGHLISPNEIFKGLGIVDTEHYRQLVVGLQDKGILNTDVKKKQANAQARRKKVPARDIPRFRVRVPSKPSHRVSRTHKAEEQLGGRRARLWAGNLPFEVRREDIVAAFSQFGRVESVELPIEWSSGRAKGFAFVQMESYPSAFEAMKHLDDSVFHGRKLAVRPAHPRKSDT